MGIESRTPREEALANLEEPAAVHDVSIPLVVNITDIRGYALTEYAAAESESVERWFLSLGDFLDNYDETRRYLIVIDSVDAPARIAHDIRLGTETNQVEHPFDRHAPLTTMDARFDFFIEDGGGDGVDLIDVRGIGLLTA